MRRSRALQVFALGAVLLAVPQHTRAQGVSEGDWVVRDFRFHTGEQLAELRLHYTVVGSPARDPVLLLHWSGGSGAEYLERVSELFARGQALDTARYFIILPDAIGHGRSSKPSDGLRTRFPRYDYDDMVQAQYRLLTERLGVRHLRLVLGFSMGGMHTWLWGVKYPDLMDAIVPLASEPAAMGGRNWMMRRMVIDAIRHDPNWKRGNYKHAPTAWLAAREYAGIATNGGARALYNAFPNGPAADAELDRRLANAANEDANDVLYQYEAAHDYDPGPGLYRIKARVLAINSADDERNPPELGVMEKVMPRLKAGRYVLLPVNDQSRGHGTTMTVGLWKGYLAELLGGSPTSSSP